MKKKKTRAFLQLFFNPTKQNKKQDPKPQPDNLLYQDYKDI